MKIRSYITHKNAEKYSDCADYFGICCPQKRVAVSDGVSQSIMPLEWAKILVSAFITGSWDPNQSISELQSKWLEEANVFLNEQRSQGINPWMLENCLFNKDGAGATFCGVVFKDESHWDACILGDSCLVVINEQNKIVNILSSKEGKFDNRPDYFDSFREKRGDVKNISGELKENQKILLVSDPFSELFQNMKNTENEKIIVDKILSLKTFDDFIQIIDDFRNSYQMHNDDSTLVLIEFDGKSEITVTDSKSLDELITEELQVEQEANKAKETDILFWNKAKETHTKESYDEYLTKSTLLLFEREAKVEIKKFELKEKDQEEWQKAQNTNTLQSYKSYPELYPKGVHTPDTNSRIEKIKQKSSGSENGNCQEEQSETSSEDSDSCGQNINYTENTALCNNGLEMAEKHDSTNNATAMSEDTGTEPATTTAEAAMSEDTGTEPATTTAEATMSEDTGTEPATTTAEGTFNGRDSRHQEEVATEVNDNDAEKIAISPVVDSSNGIDRQEFKALITTAIQLFNKHSSSFRTAFSEPKWRNKPQECFAKFWTELEEIIYNNHG